MSDYWVSKKKYFCKYCDIYIADDAPSRQQHENGLRHKGSVERFIRGIYKAGEKQKKDLEEEKREMKRVEQAAAAAFAQDVGSGLAKLPAPVASTSTAPKKAAVKSSNPYANYSTAQSLGYDDPDADRLAAEAEVRRSQGVAGEWQVVSKPQPPVASSSTLSESVDPPLHAPEDAGLKREAEAPLDDEDTRAFKLRKKTLASGLGEIYDPGLIPIKIKRKEEPTPVPSDGPSNARTISEQSSVAAALKWTPTQWKRPGDASNVKVEETPSQTEEASQLIDTGSSKWAKPQWSQPLPDLKQEERKGIFGHQPETAANEPDVKTEPDVKEEEKQTPALSETPSSSGVIFKKRKAPASTARGRREV